MELKLNIDRLRCITDEFKSIIQTGVYSSVKLVITESDIKITPLSDEVKIVLKRPDEVEFKQLWKISVPEIAEDGK